jgi:hypothetical protein
LHSAAFPTIRTLPLFFWTHAVMTFGGVVWAMATPPTSPAVRAAAAMAARTGDLNLLMGVAPEVSVLALPSGAPGSAAPGQATAADLRMKEP